MGDNVNAKGVSLAIAHVNHAHALRLGKALLIGPNPTSDAEVHDAVSNLITSGGVLDRLNVAHMATPDERATQELCRAIVAEFRTKYPADTD
jgi:hypothetical protein